MMLASNLSKKGDLHASFKILNGELKKDLAEPFIYLLIPKHFHKLTLYQASSHTLYFFVFRYQSNWPGHISVTTKITKKQFDNLIF